MATTYNHVQLGVVNENGNVDVLYPQNTAIDVSIDRSSNSRIPSNIDDVQGLVDKVGEMAFVDKDKMVFLGDSDEYKGPIETSEINDNIVDNATTWSSKKINDKATIIDLDIQLGNYDCITATPVAPKVVTFKSGNPILVNLTPNKSIDYHWIIEYFPVTSTDGVVSVAYQRWTGIHFVSNEVVQYKRVYVNNSWDKFTTL